MSQVIDQATTTLLAEHVRHLVQLMGFTQVQVHCQTLDEGALRLAIRLGADGRLLIGVQGAHLEALQHIVRMIIRRQFPELGQITIDVNDYRAQRERQLVAVAEEAAVQVTKTSQTVLLRPMTASERRIIHATLTARSDVKTESMGEEPRRRVVVKPVLF